MLLLTNQAYNKTIIEQSIAITDYYHKQEKQQLIQRYCLGSSFRIDLNGYYN